MMFKGSEKWLWGERVEGDKKRVGFRQEHRVRLSIDNRRKVKFWKDRWSGDSSLEESFLSLFYLAINKDTWVVDVWE